MATQKTGLNFTIIDGLNYHEIFDIMKYSFSEHKMRADFKISVKNGEKFVRVSIVSLNFTDPKHNSDTLVVKGIVDALYVKGARVPLMAVSDNSFVARYTVTETSKSGVISFTNKEIEATLLN